jgi:hypothetical protein
MMRRYRRTVPQVGCQQRQFGFDIGCRFGQGYLYARPMGPAAIESLLAEGDGLARPIEPERAGEATPDLPHLRVVGD